MRRTRLVGVLIVIGVIALGWTHSAAQKPRRNVIVFVADGLRPGSVNVTDAPTLWAIRNNGVNFANSHAIFPTFTTANASALATGHYLGDTGDFSNTIYIGYPVFDTGNFGRTPGSYVPFVENDQVLGDLDDHYGGNYLGEETLLAAARAAGYSTATVGKLGPAAILDAAELQPVNRAFTTPLTVLIDDATGPGGVPLPAAITAALTSAGLGTTPTPRNQPAGNNVTPGTLSANVGQQQWFADAVTKAVLPTFKTAGAPFMLVFWSRDPDGTQHNQGDSLNSLVPGINGPTSKASIKNADNNLKQILDYINSDPQLAANTDVFVTADHGFATISRHEIDRSGRVTSSFASRFTYKDTTGHQEVNTGFLPPGFLAIDLAHALNLTLFDPDGVVSGANGNTFVPVDPTVPQSTTAVRQHPAAGNGLLGGSGRQLPVTDARAVVAANGGSDLIYVPDHDVRTVSAIVEFLAGQDYIGGLFVDDVYGDIPGALPLSFLNFKGSTALPVPAIVVNFKTFALDPANPLNTAVQIADTTLQEGQGMHGTLSRDNTFNNMAAIGPDFKSHFTDQLPISNADVAPTLAHILGVSLPPVGALTGRVLEEALVGRPDSTPGSLHKVIRSGRAASGGSTLLHYQQLHGHRYLDAACLIRVAANPHQNACQ